ncbi:MAG: 2Fe-2S iron-sulfur cluster-binding protein [Stenotrophobium sp.]
MVEVRLIDRSGVTHTLDATHSPVLMEVLRDANTGVQGTCGGACACGTCHVYVKQAWADKLPPKTEDEQLMLDAIGELIEVRPSSRLSCQIPMDEKLSGIEVEIGPEVP